MLTLYYSQVILVKSNVLLSNVVWGYPVDLNARGSKPSIEIFGTEVGLAQEEKPPIA